MHNKPTDVKYLFTCLLATIFLQSCYQTKKVVEKTSIEKKENIEMEKNPDIFQEKLKQGIDFLASGNEPFWSLEIDFDKSMHFKTPDGFELNTPVPNGVKAMDANVTRYSTQTEQGILTVQIVQQECINDMSGEKLRYAVTVDAKNNTDKDFQIYKGCGRYLEDYRLHDIWVLDSINNKKTQPSDFMKGLPLLELNLTEQKVFGHTGCNNLTGSIEVQGNAIHFGLLSTTRMACNNIDLENRYINSLTGKTIPYKIEPGKLHLQVSRDSLYIYKKVD
jgi:uncharacterized membrane protein/heat shock protein HslJ